MLAGLLPRLTREVGKVVIGREREVRLLLTSFLARGHVLLEGVPGTSKTLLAKAFARALGLSFKRVQFTPDMLPLDVIGGFIFNMKSREFEFRRGPIFTNILLADEINRAPPKVQSALLEAMQELQVTVEGYTERLPNPFFVIATQNPVEFEGVYPLPEGELDRFMMKVDVDYPDLKVEAEIVRRNLGALDVGEVGVVVDTDMLPHLFSAVESVRVSQEMLDYLARLAHETRRDSRLSLGVSPRAIVHLTHAARAHAALEGRDYVTPDDVKAVAGPVLAHRVKLERTAVLRGLATTPLQVIREVLDRVRPPR